MGISGISDNSMISAGLRGAQAILGVIVLGLTAYVCSWWRGYYHDGSPSQVAFLLFCSVFAFVTLTYLIIVQWRFENTTMSHPYITTGVEGLTMLFWFSGFIAMAVFLGDRVCFGHVCAAAKAATVFGALEWLLFTVTFAFAVTRFFSGRGGQMPKYG